MDCTKYTSTNEDSYFKVQQLQDPLNQLRFIKVAPLSSDGRDDTIHCELVTAYIDRSPDYTAISYTWGSAESLTSIVVNRQRCAVTQNCHYVLKQIRDLGVSDYIWLDAVCINQRDEHEKSVQVSMMGTIYQRASQVFTCVGHHEDDSEFVHYHIDNFKVHRDEWMQKFDELPDNFTKIPDGLEEWKQQKETWDLYQNFRKMPFEDLDRLIRGFQKYSYRIYFHRLWVIQELFLSQKAMLLCGSSYTDFRDFERLITMVETYVLACRRLEDDAHSRVTQPRWSYAMISLLSVRTVSGHWSNMDLIELMGTLAYADCENPRDRVFAVLSMVNWKGRVPLTADYSISPWQLALQVCRHMCFQSKDSNVIDSMSLWHLIDGVGPMVLGLAASQLEFLINRRRRETAYSILYTLVLPDTMSATSKPALLRFQADDYCQLRAMEQNTDSLLACLIKLHPANKKSTEKNLFFRRYLAQQNTHLRRVYGGANEILAIVPRDSRADDFLLHYSSWDLLHSDMKLGLVIRRLTSSSNKFSIVGSAILHQDAAPCTRKIELGNTCGLAPEFHSSMGPKMAFIVNFAPDDMLVFALQSQIIVQGEPRADAARTWRQLEVLVNDPENPFASFVECHPMEE